MSKKKRRRFNAEQKAEVLRRLLFKKEKVSNPAEEYGVQPSMIYRWQQAAETNVVFNEACIPWIVGPSRVWFDESSTYA